MSIARSVEQFCYICAAEEGLFPAFLSLRWAQVLREEHVKVLFIYYLFQ